MISDVKNESVAGHRRIDELALPRPLPQEYIEDRRSVYWIDYLPPKPGPNGITIITASERIQELARPRPVHPMWRPPRKEVPGVPTKLPVCTCSKPKSRGPTQSHIDLLSKPKIVPFPKIRMNFDRLSLKMPMEQPQKTVHKDFFEQLAKPRENIEQKSHKQIKETASQKKRKSTVHIEQLSKPKQRPDVNLFIKYENEVGFQPVSEAAKHAQPSERAELMSIPREFAEEYQEKRFHHWKVATAALRAIASLRLQQIARPRQRTMVKDDYDPYKIPVQVKKATCTPRVQELCEPIPRKVREKKIF